MLTVRELMTDDLVTVTPDSTLREAAEVMAEAHVSGLPVVQGGMAVGVISARDFMGFAADPSAAGFDPGRSPATETTGRSGAEIPSGYYMKDWFEESQATPELLTERDSPEWEAIEEHRVEEFMTRALITLDPDATVNDAAEAMLEERVRRLLVVDVDRLVGLISATDVLGVVADRGVGA